jgi:hypothetical protein
MLSDINTIHGCDTYMCAGSHVTVTSYHGPLRTVIQHLLRTLGFQVMLEMKPGRCTHVLAADVADVTSRKIDAAREYVPNMAFQTRLVMLSVCTPMCLHVMHRAGWL